MRGVRPPRLVSHGDRGVKDRTGNDTCALAGEALPSKDFFCGGGPEFAGEAPGAGIASDLP